MKVYLISSVPSGGEEILDVLDNSNVSVISKEVRNDDAAAVEVEKHVANGNADVLILVTSDHMSANIELNKIDGVRAAICKDGEDVQEARESGANVIIVQQGRGNKEEIAQAVVSSGGGLGKVLQLNKQKKKVVVERPQERMAPEKKERQIERPQVQQQYREPSAPISINIRLPQIFKPKKKVIEKEADEQVVLPAGKPRSGILGKLKDELGIID
ncbi:MAG: RpiB/LacA/LacB family sugar-phosphate isomerase [Candidatus Micrarchaeota archaeon]|nr:RpiB/LacA/LacB family sugar-phosphate isomerase [Candidatus Micrarchaeota archaeon]